MEDRLMKISKQNKQLEIELNYAKQQLGGQSDGQYFYVLFSLHMITVWWYMMVIFSRGYAKHRNDYCCGSEYANLSLTHM